MELKFIKKQNIKIKKINLAKLTIKSTILMPFVTLIKVNYNKKIFMLFVKNC